jgi:phage shock protein E
MNLNELIRQPETTLVDVREPFELSMGNVPGAVNIPLGQIADRIEELRSLSKPLVLFCASGGRSGRATRYLQSMGLKEVHNGGGFFAVNNMLNQQVS